MSFRPAEGSQLAVDVVESETFWVEPRLTHVISNGIGGQAGLFGVPREGSIVHVDKLIDVILGERSCHDVGGLVGERSRHLQQCPV